MLAIGIFSAVIPNGGSCAAVGLHGGQRRHVVQPVHILEIVGDGLDVIRGAPGRHGLDRCLGHGKRSVVGSRDVLRPIRPVLVPVPAHEGIALQHRVSQGDLLSVAVQSGLHAVGQVRPVHIHRQLVAGPGEIGPQRNRRGLAIALDAVLRVGFVVMQAVQGISQVLGVHIHLGERLHRDHLFDHDHCPVIAVSHGSDAVCIHNGFCRFHNTRHCRIIQVILGDVGVGPAADHSRVRQLKVGIGGIGQGYLLVFSIDGLVTVHGNGRSHPLCAGGVCIPDDLVAWLCREGAVDTSDVRQRDHEAVGVDMPVVQAGRAAHLIAQAVRIAAAHGDGQAVFNLLIAKIDTGAAPASVIDIRALGIRVAGVSRLVRSQIIRYIRIADLVCRIGVGRKVAHEEAVVRIGNVDITLIRIQIVGLGADGDLLESEFQHSAFRVVVELSAGGVGIIGILVVVRQAGIVRVCPGGIHHICRVLIEERLVGDADLVLPAAIVCGQRDKFIRARQIHGIISRVQIILLGGICPGVGDVDTALTGASEYRDVFRSVRQAVDCVIGAARPMSAVIQPVIAGIGHHIVVVSEIVQVRGGAIYPLILRVIADAVRFLPAAALNRVKQRQRLAVIRAAPNAGLGDRGHELLRGHAAIMIIIADGGGHGIAGKIDLQRQPALFPG